jgi:hypothetical protein
VRVKAAQAAVAWANGLARMDSIGVLRTVGLGASHGTCAMSELRKEPRHRTLKTGRIVFNQRRSVLDCTVRNLSSTGACLDVPSTVGIPDAFELIIESESITRVCRIAWRSEAAHWGAPF